MQTFVTVQCGYCKKEIQKYIGYVNRAKKSGMGLYCNQTCSSALKKTTPGQKKAVKAKYDKALRQTDENYLYKAFLFHLDYAANPEKYRQIRRNKYPKHLLYLKTPKYRNYKKQYDELHRAKKLYGEFSEASIALKRLEEELESKQIKYDTGITIHKSAQKRKRQWNSLQVKISKTFSGTL